MPAQTTPCPFEMVLEPANFTTGTNVTVTIKLKQGAEASAYFSGFQISAHPRGGMWNDIQGEFLDRPQDSRVLYFFSNKANCLTHSNSSRRTSVSAIWKAPSSAVGDLLFSATVMTDYRTFWVNVSALLVSGGAFNKSSLGPVLEIASPPAADAPFDACGSSKTCLLWPRTCTNAKDCDVALAYSAPRAGYVRFQMSALTPGYLSLGLSLDKKMSNDETLTCLVQPSGSLLFQRGYNPGYNNQPVTEELVSNVSMRYENGRLYCDFVRPAFAYLTVMTARKTVQYPFDLSQAGAYYLYLGWGRVYPGSYGSLLKHDVLPVVSPDTMNMSNVRTYYFNSLPTEIQVHITLMVVAWVGLASIAAVVARYFRSGVLNAGKLNRKPAWLQIHRGMTFAAVPLTLAGFVLIFAYMRRWSKTAAVHAGFGVAVAALTVLQSATALCRPQPTSSRRRAFAWFHRIVGGLTWVCAATCVVLGVNVAYVPPRLALWGTAVSALWIALQVLFVVILEALQCCSESKSGGGETSVGDMSMEEKLNAGRDLAVARGRSAVFVVYAVSMTALVAAGVAFAWAY